ncbi:MAG: retropepsin-like aspartic protease [Gammaproteobacteria bacterium]
MVFCIFSAAAYADELTTISIDLSTRTPMTDAYIEEDQVRLSFDSGARMPIILKQTVLDRVRGVHLTGRYRHSTDAAGRQYKNPEFRLRQIRLDQYATNNIVGNLYKPWGVRFNPNESNSSTTVPTDTSWLDGVFGLDIFKNKRLIIDYPSEKLVVLHRNYFPEPYKSMQWVSCQRRMDKSGFVIQATFFGKNGWFLLDTGATGSFIRPSFLDIESSNISVTGDFQISKETQPSKITFYLYEFAVPKVDGVLGYNFFADKRVYLEYKVSHRNSAGCLISTL